MHHLIYVSSAKKIMSEGELFELLDHCRENNNRVEITGMLLYKGGNFMQLIEGEEETVLNLFEVIKEDERHEDVTTIVSEEISARTFENWTMGFCNMDVRGDLPKFDEFISETLDLRALSQDAKMSYTLLSEFNERNPR